MLSNMYCSLHSARVDDFVGALKQLHVDFHWPYPMLSLSALQHVSSGSLSFFCESQCVTLLSACNCVNTVGIHLSHSTFTRHLTVAAEDFLYRLNLDSY